MKRGFTLLEMIIVVGVLAALILLTVPNIQKAMGMIHRKGCEAQVKVVDTAVLEFKLEYDEFPSSVSDLAAAGFLSEKQLVCPDGRAIELDNGQAYAE